VIVLRLEESEGLSLAFFLPPVLGVRAPVLFFLPVVKPEFAVWPMSVEPRGALERDLNEPKSELESLGLS
jgi:hypothetical protein